MSNVNSNYANTVLTNSTIVQEIFFFETVVKEQTFAGKVDLLTESVLDLISVARFPSGENCSHKRHRVS
jgi:hypothetical protein